MRYINIVQMKTQNNEIKLLCNNTTFINSCTNFSLQCEIAARDMKGIS